MKVSVCIPTFNGEEFLSEALVSIKQQTYRNFEVIISDDSSEDNTLEVLESFKKESDFPINIYHHNPTTIGENWNNCISKANGEYIKFLFQDDYLLPDCLEKMVETLEANKEIGLVACKRKIKVEGAPTEFFKDWISQYDDLQKDLNLLKTSVSLIGKDFFKSPEFRQLPHNKIGEPSVVMFRKACVLKTGLFRSDLIQLLDCEFYYRVLKYNKIAIIPENLAVFRIHEKQSTSRNSTQSIPDYFLYDKILYEEFFYYLSFQHQKQLFLKFNLMGRFIKRFKNVYRRK